MSLTARSLYTLGLAVLLALPVGPVHADTLCPDLAKGEKSLSVNDMADLQFDIGRLGLCLQRARLLQQMDEIVKKREDLRMAPAQAPAVEVSGLSAIPRMDSPLPPLPSGESALRAPASPLPPAKPVLAPEPVGEWKIQRIWGQGNVMQAQLIKDGVIANVKSGDTLPSGEKVVDLSGKGVSLNDGRQQKALGWAADELKTDKAALTGSMESLQ